MFAVCWRGLFILIVLQIAACNSAVEDVNSAAKGPRVSENLLALYDFRFNTGLYSDTSLYKPRFELYPSDPLQIQELEDGIRINGPVTLATNTDATKLMDYPVASNALTVEAWLRPDNLSQTGPARIVSLSGGRIVRNFSLGQENDQYIMRLNTSDNNANGSLPSFDSVQGLVTTELTHIVFTWDGEMNESSLYIDGNLVQRSNTIFTGNLSSWTPYPFVIANEIGVPRPWLGEIYLVAIYYRALTGQEVRQNFNAKM